MAIWYYVEERAAAGPVDDVGLRHLALAGRLAGSSLVTPVGATSWSTLAEHEAALGLDPTPEGGYRPAEPPRAAPVAPPAEPPVAVAPLADAQVAVATAAEAPTAVAPAADAPVAEAPTAVAPAADAPVAEAPVAVAPVAMAPVAPTGQAPAGEAPAAVALASPTAVAGSPGPGAPEPAAPSLRAAALARRAAAVLVDGVLFGLPALTVALLTDGVAMTDAQGQAAVRFEAWGLALTALLALAYHGLLVGVAGQTPGKLALGVRVVDERRGTPIGAGRGVARAAATVAMGALCGLPLVVDLLWPLADGRRRALHDRLVGSWVVDAR